MKLPRKLTSLLLLSLILAETAACGSAPSEAPSDSTTSADTSTAADETTKDPGYVCDIPDDVRFDGETFTFAIYENANTNNHMLVDEEDGDTMNDAMFKRRRMTEERFGITLEELVYDDNPSKFRTPIQVTIPSISATSDVQMLSPSGRTASSPPRQSFRMSTSTKATGTAHSMILSHSAVSNT